MNSKIKEITLLAISTAILIIQEFAFSFIPNIQLTTFLIMVYVRVFGLKKTLTIVIIHVIIDNLLFGSIGMLNIVIPMMIAWILIAIIFYFVQKKTNNILVFAIFAYLFGHLYGMIFVPFQAFILQIDILTYLLIDILWQIVMGIGNLLAVLWLFHPLSNVLNDLYSQYVYENKKG
ncbi:MAG: hypothetical protein K9L64_01965 [Candidatus Izimaplasma sp.]|nr:hypothetical protein [Candidatus Izimaplasma bacterium]